MHLAAAIAEIGVAEIVGHDEDDVRPILGLGDAPEQQRWDHERDGGGERTVHWCFLHFAATQPERSIARPQKDRLRVAQITSLSKRFRASNSLMYLIFIESGAPPTFVE